MWSMHTMKFYSDVKKIEMMSFAGNWMEPEAILLRKISKVQANALLFAFTEATPKYTYYLDVDDS